MQKYPDLTGKKILITGATDGIGKELSRLFARTGASLILHGRSPERLAATMKSIRDESGNTDIQTSLADFASLRQVKAMACEIVQKENHLDLLVNNAGLFPKEKSITEDGFEQTLQVNYIAPFTLTQLLLPILGGQKPSRIVNLTSIGHRYVWPNIRGTHSRFFFGWVAYCRSKLLIIPATKELANRLTGANVTVNCIHPGVIQTKLTHMLPASWGVSVHYGATTVFNLAVCPKFEAVTGAYIEEFQIAKPSLFARSRSLQKRLWQSSLRWAGNSAAHVSKTPHEFG
ncbi:MAG: SDR family NAD(P)-dependent oxidoreductase [Anaerolineaceae bacterium]|nr:SDR family NAD(P)-dependent oxidoreductase [Anaerolineaceae bacterium]